MVWALSSFCAMISSFIASNGSNNYNDKQKTENLLIELMHGLA